jgi:F-type H+-transporting ATPase subunit b
MFAESTFWVAVSFAIFVGLVLYFRVPKRVTDLLDARADEIKRELEEAKRLREEAQALLAKYQRQQRDAEKEAQEIVELAKTDAERLAEETRTQLQQQMERRRKQAEDKIAQAEAQALKEVRDLTADVAISAARRAIAEKMDASRREALTDESIRNLGGKLN